MVEKTLMEKVTRISDQLHALMRDPQPGLFTWYECVGAVLTEAAECAPTPTPSSVYVIGLPMTGGCWIPMGKHYRSWETAEKQLEKERNENYPCQIFTLEEVLPDKS